MRLWRHMGRDNRVALGVELIQAGEREGGGGQVQRPSDRSEDRHPDSAPAISTERWEPMCLQ